jgi:small-conductance mechanosensitive channel
MPPSTWLVGALDEHVRMTRLGQPVVSQSSPADSIRHLVALVLRLPLVLLAALAILFSVPLTVGAADPPPAARPDDETTIAPVELDGQMLFRVRGTSSFPAHERAARIRDKIVEVARDRRIQPGDLEVKDLGTHFAIVAGPREVVNVYDADARIEQLRARELALAHLERIGPAIEAYRKARDPRVLLRNALYAVGATIVLALLVVIVVLAARRLGAAVGRWAPRRIRAVEARSFRMLTADQMLRTLRAGVTGLRSAVIVALILVYLHVVLRLFPWTRGLADDLLELVVNPLATIGLGLVAHIPNLIFLFVLAVLVRLGLRVLRMFFGAVARGAITFNSFDAEWAWPTYKIVRFAIIALAVVVAYPYVPGSQTDAFKGITLFVGLVFSLGSSSVIANTIAGYSMMYRRAFRVGDRIKFGDLIGDVTEIRPQVTHLRTLKNEDVTVPNSAILNAQVTNYSALAATQGLILHTNVGIGYETPWRQVEAMLLAAAERTAGVARDLAPFVLHKALGDFAVDYELNVYCRDARLMMPIYTELHRNILDVFNEHGVQIMTPAYEGDPAEPKVVPKDQWYMAPAQRREDGAGPPVTP